MSVEFFFGGEFFGTCRVLGQWMTEQTQTGLTLAHLHQVKGYECIKILIATLLTGLKGLMKYKADVALKRKIVFPLFSTINVCGEKKKRNN